MRIGTLCSTASADHVAVRSADRRSYTAAVASASAAAKVVRSSEVAETMPNKIAAHELLAAVSKILARVHPREEPPALPGVGVPMPEHELDEKGRRKMPAQLLTA